MRMRRYINILLIFIITMLSGSYKIYSSDLPEVYAIKFNKHWAAFKIHYITILNNIDFISKKYNEANLPRKRDILKKIFHLKQIQNYYHPLIISETQMIRENSQEIPTSSEELLIEKLARYYEPENPSGIVYIRIDCYSIIALNLDYLINKLDTYNEELISEVLLNVFIKFWKDFKVNLKDNIKAKYLLRKERI